jgi:ketosteroid isomerase-like protein
MHDSPVVVLCALLLSASLPAEAQDRSAACSSTDVALHGVVYEFWSAYNRRDAASLDAILDDQLLFINVFGAVQSKAEFLKSFRGPEGSIVSASADKAEDVHTTVAGPLAIISFNRRWTHTFKAAAITVGGTSRMTETLVCRDGRWKVIAFQETVVPNATRSPDTTAAAHYGDYVGKYRFGVKADGAEITVTLEDGRLFERWGGDAPIELLPGKHDTFFVRGIPWVETFVRDKGGRVTGILYTFEDGEMEAKRVP